MVIEVAVAQKVNVLDVLELDCYFVGSENREEGAHDDLVKVILPKHVRVGKKNLFHCLESNLCHDLTLRTVFAEVFAELDCLEGDLVQDTFTEFFVDGLNFFGGELLIGEKFLNVGDVLSISPEFFRDDIDFDIEKVDFDVGGHGFIEFEEEVDCAPQADGGDGESVFEALKGEVDVGDKEDDFDGNKEDGFHDFGVLSF